MVGKTLTFQGYNGGEVSPLRLSQGQVTVFAMGMSGLLRRGSERSRKPYIFTSDNYGAGMAQLPSALMTHANHGRLGILAMTAGGETDSIEFRMFGPEYGGDITLSALLYGELGKIAKLFSDVEPLVKSKEGLKEEPVTVGRGNDSTIVLPVPQTEHVDTSLHHLTIIAPPLNDSAPGVTVLQGRVNRSDHWSQGEVVSFYDQEGVLRLGTPAPGGGYYPLPVDANRRGTTILQSTPNS